MRSFTAAVVAGMAAAAAWGVPARADGLPGIADPPHYRQHQGAALPPPPPPVAWHAPPPPVPYYAPAPPVFYYAPPPPPVLLYAPPPPPAVLLPAPLMPGLFRCPPGAVVRYDPAGFGLCAP